MLSPSRARAARRVYRAGGCKTTCHCRTFSIRIHFTPRVDQVIRGNYSETSSRIGGKGGAYRSWAHTMMGVTKRCVCGSRIATRTAASNDTFCSVIARAARSTADTPSYLAHTQKHAKFVFILLCRLTREVEELKANSSRIGGTHTPKHGATP